MSAPYRREVLWVPGHVRGGRYGIATLRCRMVLHGALGSVSLEWSTGIYPEQIPSRYGRQWRQGAPSGSHVGYHFDAPRDYQGDDSGAFSHDCDLRPGGSCYWDASYTDADRLLAVFLLEGDEALWTALEQRYRDWVVELAQETVA